MNEFDKWLNDDNCSLRNYTKWNHRELCMCETAWKAALEWIKYAGVLGPSLANDLIDDELGE